MSEIAKFPPQIAPHGGILVDRILRGDGLSEALDSANRQVQVTLSDQNLADLVRRNIVSPGEARGKAKFPENFPG